MNTLQVFNVGKVATQFAIVQSAYVGEFFILVDDTASDYTVNALEEIKASIRSRRTGGQAGVLPSAATHSGVQRYTADEVAEFLTRSIYFK